jgi:hypothetical protein
VTWWNFSPGGRVVVSFLIFIEATKKIALKLLHDELFIGKNEIA